MNASPKTKLQMIEKENFLLRLSLEKVTLQADSLKAEEKELRDKVNKTKEELKESVENLTNSEKVNAKIEEEIQKYTREIKEMEVVIKKNQENNQTSINEIISERELAKLDKEKDCRIGKSFFKVENNQLVDVFM